MDALISISKSLKLLYVEDDIAIRQETTAILNDIFKVVFDAVDGEDGLRLFKNHFGEIDLVITDITMSKKMVLR